MAMAADHPLLNLIASYASLAVKLLNVDFEDAWLV
jgi:hypothetical protein